MVTDQACPKALSVKEIGEARKQDPNLHRVREALPLRQWKSFLEGAKILPSTDQSVRNQLWRVQEELSMNEDGLILRGRKIVIPQSLWDRAVDLAHQGVA